MSAAQRIKHQAAIYGAIAGAVLIVLGIASIAAGGYVYTNPPVEEIPPQETDVQTFETAVEHRAEVTSSTPLYEPPATVENQPVYFINGTPTVRLEADADLPDDRPVNVSHTLLLYREVTFQGTKFWSERDALATDQAVVEDGELQVEADLDVPAAAVRTTEIQTAVADVGTVSTGVILRTTYETQSTDGDVYAGELIVDSGLEITERAYWFEDELVASETHSQLTEATVREHPPNLTVVGIFGLLGIVLVVAGAGVALWSSRSADVHGLEEKVYRARYDEWISEGDFPTHAGKQYVYINSLEDLVDIAIDTGKRVIHDPDLETYAVVDDDLVYYHASDPTTIDSWVNFQRDD